MNDLIDGLKEKVGLDDDTAGKVVAFLQEHAGDLPRWLGSAKGAIADKLPDSLGGMFGGN